MASAVRPSSLARALYSCHCQHILYGTAVGVGVEQLAVGYPVCRLVCHDDLQRLP
ncbi:MAG: hypothetical protein MSA80_03895 [Prevotella sp.]|nr:hypothetical protein [Prevotella sp.]